MVCKLPDGRCGFLWLPVAVSAVETGEVVGIYQQNGSEWLRTLQTASCGMVGNCGQHRGRHPVPELSASASVGTAEHRKTRYKYLLIPIEVMAESELSDNKKSPVWWLVTGGHGGRHRLLTASCAVLWHRDGIGFLQA